MLTRSPSLLPAVLARLALLHIVRSTAFVLLVLHCGLADMAHAQPIILGTPRADLQRAGITLDNATKTRNPEKILSALTAGEKTLDVLDTLRASVPQQEMDAFTGKYARAYGTLIDVQTLACQKGLVDVGIKTAKLMQALQRDNPKIRKLISDKLWGTYQLRLEGCLRFKLQIDSSIRAVEPDYEYRVHVDVEVIVQYDADTGLLSGVGNVKKVAQTVKSLNDCTFTPHFLGGTFTVRKMELNLDPANVNVVDVSLVDYEPALQTDNVTIVCPPGKDDAGFSLSGAFLSWGLGYMMNHEENDNVVITNWRMDIPTGAFASKNIEQTAEPGLSEATFYLLRWAPKKMP